ncbi:MAG: ATPase [Rhodobacteraceae bacterium]|nr:ATPase [Paracoccaceae bacterium]
MANVDLSKLAVREPKPAKPKRFYKTASVAPEGPPHRIVLDGKPVRTPLKKFLETDRADLAVAIAAEWDDQVEVIAHEAMPLTRLLATAIDRVGPERTTIIDELIKHIDGDLLCYRAEHPADLKARQAAVWQPILDWLSARHGVDMAVAAGIMPAAQTPEVIAGMRAVLDRMDVLALTAAQAAAGLSGSLALAIALSEGRIGGAETFAAAHLDESYQMERWGEDAEAANRREAIAADLESIAMFAELCRG